MTTGGQNSCHHEKLEPMETHDRRIIEARQFLARISKHEPSKLLAGDLTRENVQLRRLLKWAIDVVDDFADTELDEEVTQVLFAGGIYIAPADISKLCDRCMEAVTPVETRVSRPA
jgi:hypothetical protein